MALERFLSLLGCERDGRARGKNPAQRPFADAVIARTQDLLARC